MRNDRGSGTHQGDGAPIALYHDYLTVIYGLLAAEGLVVLSRLVLEHALSWSSVLLFVGTFLISLHFWFVCVTVDQLSQPFYVACATRDARRRTAFLLIDAIVAAAFAGCVLIMFHALAPDTVQLQSVFNAFLFLAILSLFYDLYSLCLVAFASRAAPAAAAGQVSAYRTVVLNWMGQDGAYVILAGFLAAAFKNIRGYDVAFACGLLVVAGAVLVLDVVVLQSDAGGSAQEEDS